MKSCIIITILSALCLGGSHTNAAAINYDVANNPAENIDFGTALEMYYTSFQHIMPCGYPPLNIPILAPFTLEYYAVNFTNGYYNIVGNVSNLEVTGLNNFRILSGTYNTTTNRTAFDMIYPEIQMLGEYSIDALAYLAGYPAEMSGTGLLNIKVIDFRMVGDFALAPSVQNSNGLRVSDFNLNYYFGDAIFNNWNTLWNISMNNFANKIAGELMLQWAQQIQVQVDDIYAQLLLPNINGYLEEVTMTNLIDYFVGQSMEFNMANCTLA